MDDTEEGGLLSLTGSSTTSGNTGTTRATVAQGADDIRQAAAAQVTPFFCLDRALGEPGEARRRSTASAPRDPVLAGTFRG